MDTVPFHLLYPLFSSLLFVVGVLFIKRASEARLGVWRITFYCNIIAALVFLALLPMGGQIHWHAWWQPALVAFLFVIGQVLSFLAIDGGDVSVVTPTMGTKTVLVAWFSSLLLKVDLPWQLWCSAVLSSVAVLALSRQSAGGSKGKPSTPIKGSIGRTILISLLAASSYALFDVLVQKWSPAWGAGRFLPIMFGFCALYSLIFIPFFSPLPEGVLPLTEKQSRAGTLSEPAVATFDRASQRAAWKWLIIGAFCMGIQALSLITALAVFADATAINVMYSARGLWSVLAVWLVGHWFHNAEKNLDKGTLIWRLIGAGLMTLAIVITLTR